MEGFINVALTVVLFFLAFCIVMGLVRAFTGKKPADRLVAVNMITTAVIMMTVILSVLFKESWLADIAAIYALVSFVAAHAQEGGRNRGKGGLFGWRLTSLRSSAL